MKNLSIKAPKQNGDAGIIRTGWGATVEVVRTVFERRNDATIYIPDLRPATGTAATVIN